MRPCCYCLTMGAWGTANNKPTRHCLTSLITQSVNSSKRTHVKKKRCQYHSWNSLFSQSFGRTGFTSKKMGLCRVWLLRADLGGPVSQSSRLMLYSWLFRAAFLMALLPPPSYMNSFQWDYVCGLSSHQWGQLPRELNECQSLLPVAFLGIWSPSDFFCVSLSDQCGLLSGPHDCFCLLPALLPFSL